MALTFATSWPLRVVNSCTCRLVLDETAPPGPVRNPIEHLFAKVKAFVKALRPDSTDTLSRAFGDALETVTPQNILNSFLHCGYGLEP